MSNQLLFVVPLPALDSGMCYQLLTVGPVTFDPPDNYSITGYFLPYPRTAFSESSLLPIAHQIDVRRSGRLIPGSLWSARGILLPKPNGYVSDYRAWYAGVRSFQVARLCDVVDPQDLSPALFWATQADMWVMVEDRGSERILIPCFEWLRAFYYHAGPRIISYCFSQLPWNLLCRPHLAPSAANGFRAQLYVAAKNLSNEEASVLGNLLFDSAYLRTLNQAHAHFAARPFEHVYAKTTGILGRNVLIRTEGHPFTHNQQKYFWVSTLIPQTTPYGFRWLLYHPVEKELSALPENADLPYCSDLLDYPHPRPKYARYNPKPVLETRFLSENYVTPLSVQKAIATAFQSTLPGVARGPAWAREPPTAAPLVWFRELPPLPESDHPSDDTTAIPTHFARLMNAFALEGYALQLLQLNNADGTFGNGVSVLPHRGFAPLPGKDYRSRVRAFYVAQVSLKDGLFFFLCSLHAPQLMLFIQKQHLGTPTPTDWGRLLEVVGRMKSSDRGISNCLLGQISGREATASSSALIVRNIPSSAASVGMCHLFVEQTVTILRLRLAAQTALQLRFPDGLSQVQWHYFKKALQGRINFLLNRSEWTVLVRQLFKKEASRSQPRT